MMSLRNDQDGNYTLFRRARSATWRRIVVGLVAAPALMAGLLAMHVVAASGSPAGQHAEMSMTMSATPLSATPTTDPVPTRTSVGGCVEFCGTSHAMGAMACILALLLTTMTIAALVAFRGWIGSGAALAVQALMAVRPRSLAPPLPPSLDFLSISRI